MKHFKICVICFLALIGFTLCGNSTVIAGDNIEKKAVLIVMDYVNTSDLIEASTPNIDKLTEKGGTGLMNIRARNRYHSSSYISIATGKRVSAPTNSEYSFNSNEIVTELPSIFKTNNSNFKANDLFTTFTGNKAPDNGVVNLYISAINRHASSISPSYTPGNLATKALENGLAIGVLGNADSYNTINRNVALLGMDKTGMISYGDVGKSLLELDPYALGGVKTNHSVFKESFNSLLKTCDILILDLGDTTRVENSRRNVSDKLANIHRINAIERNDLLVGMLLSQLDLNNTLITIVTPNPYREMVAKGNFGLTPFIFYEPSSHQGFVTSDTTRRTGLVSNHNLLPSIINFFETKSSTNGEGISIIPNSYNSIEYLDKQVNLYINLRENRNALHNTFITFALLITLWGFLYHIKNFKTLAPNLLSIIINATITIPIVFLVLAYTQYQSLIITLLILLTMSITLGVILNYVFSDPIKRLMFIAGITSFILIIDAFNGSPMMLLSPLGSDAIAGGRFYGVGNDYMGVILASTIIFSTLLSNKISFKPYFKIFIIVLLLFIAGMAAGHPRFGANVGGLISFLITIGIAIIIILGKKLNIKKLITLSIAAIVAVITIARLDSLYSANPSHAGKAINNLFEGGFTVFVDIIQTKVGILFNTVINSNWSLVLLLIIVILIVSGISSKNKFFTLSIEQPAIYQTIKILMAAAITVFIVNDTGVIASALIMLYLISCLWLALFLTEYEYR
ncbi:hypothetical protein SYNTR_0447 [Candidatus Syntrophocurvum alkaliphilum]|uniref:Phosphoglyceromutase n=1 Tax=Candidatus Syntrophocurvum alkaliphilum TaxID=2293317 RepID=A0A6I6DD67_9FIRM|nr:hypothetical protein [Candidatus Syntrophocurvum alkaliphilum]QGT99040.1 hypothetical protein SYNTR_0447 [Candidatus Syntrophocurvum alkaliphilum]